MAQGDSEELRTLKAIARWTRELALPVARARVERLLDTDGKRRVYAALERGEASMSAIEKATGVNHNDIGQWIKQWDGEGIIEPEDSPPKATFTLSELGIPPAPAKTTRKATK